MVIESAGLLGDCPPKQQVVAAISIKKGKKKVIKPKKRTQKMTKNKPQIKVFIVQQAFPNGVQVVARCENAHRFCQISGTPYLDSKQLFLIQKLGFEVVVVKE